MPPIQKQHTQKFPGTRSAARLQVSALQQPGIIFRLHISVGLHCCASLRQSRAAQSWCTGRLKQDAHLSEVPATLQ